LIIHVLDVENNLSEVFLRCLIIYGKMIIIKKVFGCYKFVYKN